jgi:uncharacterized alpha/beta hydrolase family protein
MRKVAGWFLSAVVVTVAVVGGLWWFQQHHFDANQEKYTFSNTPTLFLHGYGGGLGSTNDLVADAQKAGAAKRTVVARVSKDGEVTFSGSWAKGDVNPMVQVVLADNRNNDFQTTAKWLKNVLVALQQEYGVKKFNTVAHSMGNLTLMTYEMTYGADEKLPQLQKQVDIAGHFDGIVGMNAEVDGNQLDAAGKPQKTVSYYNWLLAHQRSYPKNQIDVLNIYGDLKDGSHSDGRVSVVSARSLRYLLGGREKSYTEKLVTGAGAQHSKLHEHNQVVNKTMINFLWGRK